MQRRSKPRRKQRDQRSEKGERRRPITEYRRLSESELFDYLELEPLDYLDDDVEGPEGEPEVD